MSKWGKWQEFTEGGPIPATPEGSDDNSVVVLVRLKNRDFQFDEYTTATYGRSIYVVDVNDKPRWWNALDGKPLEVTHWKYFEPVQADHNV